jgi:hypothetical protein
LQIVQQERVAIGCGLGQAIGGDDRAGAGDVLDDEVLAQLLRQEIRHHARSLVCRPAGGIGHDNGNGAAWILLRRSLRDEHEQANGRQHGGKKTPQHARLHSIIFPNSTPWE